MKRSYSLREFAPEAHTAWHAHPERPDDLSNSGASACASTAAPRPVEVIHPGDLVFFKPNEEHWHSAASDGFMTHIAMHQVDDQGSAAS